MKDADRALTPEGARKLHSVLRRARAVDVQPSIIVTSPYRRAKETAKVAAEVLPGAATLVESRELTPESSPQAVWDRVRAHKGEPQLMLVGHEPLLSAVYAYLLGAPMVQIDVKKGSLGRIDVDRFGVQPRALLRWLIYPKLAGD
jgi:phosphohistidine phosphatase